MAVQEPFNFRIQIAYAYTTRKQETISVQLEGYTNEDPEEGSQLL